MCDLSTWGQFIIIIQQTMTNKYINGHHSRVGGGGGGG